MEILDFSMPFGCKMPIRESLKTNSGHQRLNLHDAINAEMHEVTVIESDTVNTASTIRLIETFDQKYFLAKKILLIADNAKDHYRVRFVCLPRYSPNLILIERFETGLAVVGRSKSACRRFRHRIWWY